MKNKMSAVSLYKYRENQTQIDIKPLLNDILRREKPLNTSGVSIEKEYSSKKSLSEIFKMATLSAGVFSILLYRSNHPF